MVNAAHNVIKYSKRMRNKLLSLVRRIGKNRAIVTITRILLEKIFITLKKGEEFIDNIGTLTKGENKNNGRKSKGSKKSSKKHRYLENHKIN